MMSCTHITHKTHRRSRWQGLALLAGVFLYLSFPSYAAATDDEAWCNQTRIREEQRCDRVYNPNSFDPATQQANSNCIMSVFDRYLECLERAALME